MAFFTWVVLFLDFYFILFIYLHESHFKYLGSIIQKNGEINSDVDYRIQANWLRWRRATRVLCDRNIPLWLKGKFYRTGIKPALL